MDYLNTFYFRAAGIGAVISEDLFLKAEV